MKPQLLRNLIALLLALIGPLSAQMTVSMTASSPRIPLGTLITWNAQVESSDGDSTGQSTIWYRYRVRRFGQAPRLIRDFGPTTNFPWNATENEGSYEMEVTARDIKTGESATQIFLFEVTPLASDTPRITPTAHPLVFIYSAPPCADGERMRLEFRAPNGDLQTTPYKPCHSGLTMNFYLAGMQQNTIYDVRQTIDTGEEFQHGPLLSVTSGLLPLQLADYRVIKSPSPPASGVLLQSTLSQPTVATDLNGNVLWYYDGGISFLTRPEAGGRFLGIYEDSNADIAHQLIREFDLAGNTLLETNAARINEQLALMNRRPISGFHHEAARLPDGSILVLASVEQILTDVQGPGPVDVLGDMILVLDKNLQVTWAWDAFDHLDPHRLATLNEICHKASGGCPPFYQAEEANDWLHGNSLQLAPDGNILYSSRHQDWVFKIDYSNGTGSGDILWRLGKDGDFSYDSIDSYPWFSHQHDANIVDTDQSLLAVFDNGNVRRLAGDSTNSRGQVIKLDEKNRVARLILNADLGMYSGAVGSAHSLANGDYHFDLGLIVGPQHELMSQSVQVDPSGSIVYQIQVSTAEYRSFRMRSLYVP
jgi:arylsulfate sulfotransferase